MSAGLDAVVTVFWNRDERRLRALWRIVLHLVILVVIGVPLYFVGGVIASVGPPPPTARAFSTLVTVVLATIAVTSSLVVAGRVLDRRRFDDFGFRIDARWWADLAFGLALGAFLMAVIFVIEWSAGWVEIVDTFAPGRHGVSFPVGVIGALLIFVCVGFYEEAFSRGYQLKNLAEGLGGLFGTPPAIGVAAALVLSSAIFGLGHANNPNATFVSTFNIMLAGIFLGFGYVLTGELANSIGLHVTWNFFQGCVFGFPVSGNTVGPTFLKIRQGGPALFTGGRFGPEAGLLGIVAMALGVALIVLWVRRTRGTTALEPFVRTRVAP